MTTKTSRKRRSVSGFFQNDHRELDALLGKVRFEPTKDDRERFGEFRKRLERHIRWEEEHLFPDVGRREPWIEGGPIRVMKEEHRQIKEFLAQADDSLAAGASAEAREAVEDMKRVLIGHNQKEETILYPACDRIMGAEQSDELVGRLEMGKI